MFYFALPFIKHKLRDETQYRQELLIFELMEPVSLQHHILPYQVSDVKFQSLE